MNKEPESFKVIKYLVNKAKKDISREMIDILQRKDKWEEEDYKSMIEARTKVNKIFNSLI